MVAITFIEGAITFIGEAVTFVEGAVMFVEGAIVFVGEGGSAVGRLFKIARVRVGDVKGVNKRNLRRWLMVYKLKGPLVLINSLISISNYSIGLSL